MATKTEKFNKSAGRSLARAMLREIPLGQLEVYLQVLDSGFLRGRDTVADDNGIFCGGGCDAKGAACGAWCAFPGDIPAGCFDQWGHSGVSKIELQAAIENPEALRQLLGEELVQISRATAEAKTNLAPKVDAKAWILRA